MSASDAPLPDPRPVDVERLARLREVSRTEGADLSAWYAEMLADEKGSK